MTFLNVTARHEAVSCSDLGDCHGRTLPTGQAGSLAMTEEMKCLFTDLLVIFFGWEKVGNINSTSGFLDIVDYFDVCT